MTREEAIWHANHVFNIVIERCINAQNLKEAREFDEAKQIVIEALQQEPEEDCISKALTLEILNAMANVDKDNIKVYSKVYSQIKDIPRGKRKFGKWIPVTERLPKVNQLVLLSSSKGRVYIGSRDNPDIIWQVTESDGRKHWVYDPESYDCDIDTLPKNEDCGFSNVSRYEEDWLSATSPNCDLRFEAIIAWQPLPEPYKESDGE